MATLLLAFGALAFAQVFDDPTITPAPTPSSTDVVVFPGLSASGPCKNVICYDYINTCSIRYGTCYAACAANARPTFSGPACEGGKFRSSFSKPAEATESPDPCGYKCDYCTDSCSNTFGPGCYTSCPGSSVPSFTTPVCVTPAPPMRTVVVTPIPVISTMALMVPLDALGKRQAAILASSSSSDASSSTVDLFSSITDASSSTDVSLPSTDASSSSTCYKGAACDASSTSINASPTATATVFTIAGNSINAANATIVALYTPEPIPAGGATIGAQLSTIAPQVYGYLPSADIMDLPATAVDEPAAATTPELQSTNTEVDDVEATTASQATSVDMQILNSAIVSVQYVSSTGVASTTSEAVGSQIASDIATETAISLQLTSQVPDSDTISAISSQTSTDVTSETEVSPQFTGEVADLDTMSVVITQAATTMASATESVLPSDSTIATATAVADFR